MKDDYVRFRCSRVVKECLQELAGASSMNMSEYLSFLILFNYERMQQRKKEGLPAKILPYVSSGSMSASGYEKMLEQEKSKG